MSKEIKCPICQGVSTLRYNENRTYMSHCHDINCFKLVTVTAPSEAVAEELFSKFEKGTIQPKLSIPKKIADMLDEGDLMFLAWTHGNDLLGKVPDEERKAEIIRRNALARAYQAGKALGVNLVEVTDE